MENENDIIVAPKQIQNVIVNQDEEMQLIEHWYDITVFNNIDDVAMYCSVMLACLLLLATINLIENLVKIGDKLND